MNQRVAHPLDKLINDNSLIMLEAMVPFVDHRFKKILVIYIKYREFTLLMNNLNDLKFMDGCGFNKSAASSEDMVDMLLSTMSPDAATNISNARKMMSIMQAMDVPDTGFDLSSIVTAASDAVTGTVSPTVDTGKSAGIFSHTPANDSDTSHHTQTDAKNTQISLYDSILDIIENESET